VRRGAIAPALAVFVAAGAAFGIASSLRRDTSESRAPATPQESSRHAQQVVHDYLAATYPGRPVRASACAEPYRRSLNCTALLPPDPGESCMWHLHLVLYGGDVRESRYADCIRARN
jgi:hypothetical protein